MTDKRDLHRDKKNASKTTKMVLAIESVEAPRGFWDGVPQGAARAPRLFPGKARHPSRLFIKRWKLRPLRAVNMSVVST
jgi:hypothetical protein